MTITKEGKLANYLMELKGRCLVVTGEGLFTVELAKDFIKDFKKICATNSTMNLNLVVNTVNLKTCSQDIIPYIDEMSGLYKNTNFAKKFMVMPNSKIAGMQLKRNDTNGVFEQFEFIDAVEDAMN